MALLQGVVDVAEECRDRTHITYMDQQYVLDHVPKADLLSKSDPYIIVNTERDCGRTKTIKKCSDPVYNESFLLFIRCVP